MKKYTFPSAGTSIELAHSLLAFMQESYEEAVQAVAKIASGGSDNVILYGCELSGGNVSAGWIVYDGELLEFKAGTYYDDVVIREEEGDVSRETLRYAECAVGSSDFSFSDLSRVGANVNLAPVEVADNITSTKIDHTVSFDGADGWTEADLDSDILLRKSIILAKIKVTANEGSLGIKFRKPGDTMDASYFSFAETDGPTFENVWIPCDGKTIEYDTLSATGGGNFELTIIAAF